MASFTTRIQLRGADESHYTVLHKEMERRGFSRTVRGDNGTAYHLPDAEYVLTTDASRSAVLNSAQAAVALTGKKAGILVTEAASRSWSGLQEVE